MCVCVCVCVRARAKYIYIYIYWSYAVSEGVLLVQLFSCGVKRICFAVANQRQRLRIKTIRRGGYGSAMIVIIIIVATIASSRGFEALEARTRFARNL